MKDAGWPETLDLLRAEDAVAIAAEVVDVGLDHGLVARWLIDRGAQGRVAALARIDRLSTGNRLHLLMALDPGERFDFVAEAWADGTVRPQLVSAALPLMLDDERGLDLALTTLRTDPVSTLHVLRSHPSPRATAELEDATRVGLLEGEGSDALTALAMRSSRAHASTFLAAALDSGAYDQCVGGLARSLHLLGNACDLGAVERALERGVNDRAALLGAVDAMRGRV